MAHWEKLGLIAGGGALPGKIAGFCHRRAMPFCVVRLSGLAHADLSQYAGGDFPIGQAGKILRFLQENGCDAVAMCGLVARPDFSNLSLDRRGIALLPRLIAAASRGDGAILSVLVDVFETEGFVVLGVEEILRSLSVCAGAMTSCRPQRDHWRDISKAAEIINALGPFDVGQGAVVINGHVVAIEAAEGTDAMLARCATLRSNHAGLGNGGVLVKRPKPGQERRVDLPTIGVETIKNVAKAGLSGIALEAGAALIVDEKLTTAAAEREGIFLYGFTGDELIQ